MTKIQRILVIPREDSPAETLTRPISRHVTSYTRLALVLNIVPTLLECVEVVQRSLGLTKNGSRPISRLDCAKGFPTTLNDRCILLHWWLRTWTTIFITNVLITIVLDCFFPGFVINSFTLTLVILYLIITWSFTLLLYSWVHCSPVHYRPDPDIHSYIGVKFPANFFNRGWRELHSKLLKKI